MLNNEARHVIRERDSAHREVPQDAVNARDPGLEEGALVIVFPGDQATGAATQLGAYRGQGVRFQEMRVDELSLAKLS
jgi:hypothetical protein